MNHAWIIAGRELRDRSRLFVVAAAFAVIPFLAAMLPGAEGHRADIIAMGGAILGVALGLGTATTLGGTIIGRELSERRLSFYFAKPLSSSSIWFGKAAAALLTSIGCLLIVTVPAFSVVRNAWRAAFMSAPAVLIGAVIGIVVLFFVSHATSTMVRSRSVLVALDLAALATAAGVLYLLTRTIAFSGAIQHAGAMLIFMLIATLALLIVVPVRQLAVGRTDARRGHAAFSRTFWPAVAALLLVYGAAAAWLLTPDADDVTAVELVEQAPAGDWLLLGGQTRLRAGHRAAFAVNRAKGQAVRMPGPLWWGATFSRDGRAVAWAQPVGASIRDGFTVHVRRLDSGRTYDTGAATARGEFVLSDDGSRVAAINGNTIAVHDVATGRLLASAAGLNAGNLDRMFFASPDVVRVYEHGGDGHVPIFELNVATRAFVQTGRYAGGANYAEISQDGTRLLTRRVVVDSRTGATLVTLPEWNATVSRSRMLSDGSIARTGLVGGVSRLQLFDRNGALRHDLVLRGAQSTIVSGDTAEGKVIVAGSRGEGREPKVFVIDARRGIVESVREGVRGPMPTWNADPRRFPYQGELASVTDRGEVVLWKDAGDEPRPLLR